MNKIFTIIKKELKRYFTDKRTLVTLVLPGILIFVIYSFMGNITSNFSQVDDDHQYQVATINEPTNDNYQKMFNDSGFKVTIVNDLTTEQAKEKVQNGELDLFIYYEENFLDKISNGELPNVQLYYSSNSNESLIIYQYTENYLSQYAYNITNNFYINNDTEVHNLIKEDDQSKQFIKMLMPFLLIIFLFSGCMAICTEAIAGEKERGTIYTLLVTPTKRSEIAIGKIIALSIVSLTSATFSFLGIISSLPKLVGGAIGLNVYGPSTYVFIFIIVIITVIFFTSLLLLLSSFAKSVKEASQLALVIYIPTMLAGVISMLGFEEGKPLLSLVPIYNSITAMSNIFSGEVNYLILGLTIGSNLIYITGFIFLLTKMFNSEKIMGSN